MKQIAFIFSILTLVACGGATEATETTSEKVSENTEKNAEMVANLRVSHFSTVDGGSGFVFDQNRKPFLVQLDGSTEVIELAERDGAYSSKEYTNKEKGVWIRIYPNGRILFDGPDQTSGVDVRKDADAASLRE